MSTLDTLKPARLDFEPVKRGDTFPERPLAILSRDGQPVAVASALLQVRTRMRGLLVTEWKTINGSIILSGTPVTNTIALGAKTAAETAEFPLGNHDYDLEITLEDGVTITLFDGVFPVSKDQSRAS